MKKLFVTICTMALMSGISAHAFAENADYPHKFSPEMKAKMEQKRAEFEKKLNLTPEQKEKMKAIHQASRVKMAPIFEGLKAEHAKLVQLKQSNASPADIQAQKAKMKQIRQQIREIRKANFAQVETILTPEQQKIFKEMKENHKKHRNFEDKATGNQDK